MQRRVRTNTCVESLSRRMYIHVLQVEMSDPNDL